MFRYAQLLATPTKSGTLNPIHPKPLGVRASTCRTVCRKVLRQSADASGQVSGVQGSGLGV